MATTERVSESRLRVNPIACEAVGLCSHLAPELVELDKWGYPVLSDQILDEDEERVARRAVRSCPHRALALVPGGRPAR